jgi:hypothetical protein
MSYLSIIVHHPHVSSVIFVRKLLVGKTDIEKALKRLDSLTQEEVQMAIAQILKSTTEVKGTRSNRPVTHITLYTRRLLGRQNQHGYAADVNDVEEVMRDVEDVVFVISYLDRVRCRLYLLPSFKLDHTSYPRASSERRLRPTNGPPLANIHKRICSNIPQGGWIVTESDIRKKLHELLEK